MGHAHFDPRVDRWLRVLTLLMVIGIFIVSTLQVAGVGDSTNAIVSRAGQFLKSYPSGQMERSLHQSVQVVENLHQISSRAKYIMDRIQPGDLDALSKRVSSVTNEDVRNMMQTVGSFNQLLQQIKAEDVGSIVKNTRAISSSLNGTRLNELIDATKTIEKRLNDLHEIKIRI